MSLKTKLSWVYKKMSDDIETGPTSETTIDKKGLWKKINEEPLKDVIVAILKHSPRNDADCKEQQTSVRFALNGQTAKEIVAKISKIFMVSFVTAMIVSIAPYLPSIMAEFVAIMIKYNLIK